MNNSQFRKLVLDTPAHQLGVTESRPIVGATPRRDGATPALGSRIRSSIPMTPRSVAGAVGIDFARQLAEQNVPTEQRRKSFRSSAAPKGTRLPEGYVDRTQKRSSEDEDGKAARVKALEEMMKLQQIDEPTFMKLRDEILGGDVGTTHLVKGLDYKLLERVRRGEDVLGHVKEEDNIEREDDAGIDHELEQLEEKGVVAVTREKAEKQGMMAPPALVPGKKRNRDQILAELRASRLAAKEAAQPSLGAKFRKVGAPKATSRIEKDSRGREILIMVDENGDEKRKVRKVQADSKTEKYHGLLMPDKSAKPLGMVAPEIAQELEVEEVEVNIFDDAGDDYEPLAGLDDDSDDETTAISRTEASEVVEDGDKRTISTQEPTPISNSTASPPPVSRNYFGETKKEEEPKSKALDGFSDPLVLAALKKASTLMPIVQTPETREEAAKEAKRRMMLQQDSRDDMDLDMGFGSSRFADEEDFEVKKVKLSNWDGKGGDDEGVGKGGEGKAKRRRGPKKRKGDGNNVADVMNLLERRKNAL